MVYIIQSTNNDTPTETYDKNVCGLRWFGGEIDINIENWLSIVDGKFTVKNVNTERQIYTENLRSIPWKEKNSLQKKTNIKTSSDA